MEPTIRQYQSGITSVLFNTRDKWMEYSICCSRDMYNELHITLDTFDPNCLQYLVKRVEVIVPRVPEKYVRYVHQEKDQIEVLFVPRNLLV